MDMKSHCNATVAWMDMLCCPRCHGALEVVHGEQVDNKALECTGCNATFHGVEDSFDLTIATGERAREQQHYQDAYLSRLSAFRTELDPERLLQRWEDSFWPEGRLILGQLGDLSDKVVLCLGNGPSTKELHFLALGAKLICSDLSVSGVLAAKSEYDLGALASRAAFHAMDACSIPLKDHSVDVVYGYEFVHHLSDLDVFFREVHRVLKPGGLCIFYDNAYSPIYEGAKRTVLWPLMRLSHLLHKRSPEDLRATHAGGYREFFLQDLAARHGFSGTFFKRVMFFQYLTQTGVGSLLGWKLPKAFYRIPSACGWWLDRLVTDRSGFLRKNRIAMVWGFRS